MEPLTVNAGKTPPTDPLTDSERRKVLRVAATVGAVLVLASAAIAIGESISHPAQPDGPCINVSVASSMGGGIERACGISARTTCHAARQLDDAHSVAVRKSCADARILP